MVDGGSGLGRQRERESCARTIDVSWVCVMSMTVRQ